MLRHIISFENPVTFRRLLILGDADFHNAQILMCPILLSRTADHGERALQTGFWERLDCALLGPKIPV